MPKYSKEIASILLGHSSDKMLAENYINSIQQLLDKGSDTLLTTDSGKGNFGHSGRAGKVGGSAKTTGPASEDELKQFFSIRTTELFQQTSWERKPAIKDLNKYIADPSLYKASFSSFSNLSEAQLLKSDYDKKQSESSLTAEEAKILSGVTKLLNRQQLIKQTGDAILNSRQLSVYDTSSCEPSPVVEKPAIILDIGIPALEPTPIDNKQESADFNRLTNYIKDKNNQLRSKFADIDQYNVGSTVSTGNYKGVISNSPAGTSYSSPPTQTELDSMYESISSMKEGDSDYARIGWDKTEQVYKQLLDKESYSVSSGEMYLIISAAMNGEYAHRTDDTDDYSKEDIDNLTIKRDAGLYISNKLRYIREDNQSSRVLYNTDVCNNISDTIKKMYEDLPEKENKEHFRYDQELLHLLSHKPSNSYNIDIVKRYVGTVLQDGLASYDRYCSSKDVTELKFATGSLLLLEDTKGLIDSYLEYANTSEANPDLRSNSIKIKELSRVSTMLGAIQKSLLDIKQYAELMANPSKKDAAIKELIEEGTSLSFSLLSYSSQRQLEQRTMPDLKDVSKGSLMSPSMLSVLYGQAKQGSNIVSETDASRGRILSSSDVPSEIYNYDTAVGRAITKYTISYKHRFRGNVSKTITHAIENSPIYTNNLYRSMGADDDFSKKVLSMKEGQSFTMTNRSCTRNPAVVQRLFGEVLLTIKGPHNEIDINAFSAFPEQSESLVAGKFKILSKSTVAGGKTLIEIEQMPNKKSKDSMSQALKSAIISTIKKVMDIAGKGNHGHSGRSGKVGGSAPSNNTPVDRDKIKEHIGSINIGKDMYTDIGTFNKYVNKALENDNLDNYFGSFKDQSTLDTFNNTLSNLVQSSKKDPTNSAITEQLKKMGYSLNRLIMAKEVAQKIRDERQSDSSEKGSQPSRSPQKQTQPEAPIQPSAVNEKLVDDFYNSVSNSLDIFSPAKGVTSDSNITQVGLAFMRSIDFKSIQSCTREQKTELSKKLYKAIDSRGDISLGNKSYMKGMMNNIYKQEAFDNMKQFLGSTISSRFCGVGPRSSKNTTVKTRAFPSPTAGRVGEENTVNARLSDLPTLMTVNGYVYMPSKLRYNNQIKMACITNVIDSREATRFENMTDGGRNYDNIKVGSRIELEAQHFTSAIKAFEDASSMFGGSDGRTRVRMSIVGQYPSMDLEQFVYKKGGKPKSMQEYEKLIAGNFKVVSVVDNRKGDRPIKEDGLSITLEYDWDSHKSTIDLYNSHIKKDMSMQSKSNISSIKDTESKFVTNYILDSVGQLNTIASTQSKESANTVERLMARNIHKYIKDMLRPYSTISSLIAHSRDKSLQWDIEATNLQKTYDDMKSNIKNYNKKTGEWANEEKKSIAETLSGDIARAIQLSDENKKIHEKYTNRHTSLSSMERYLKTDRDKREDKLLGPVLGMLEPWDGKDIHSQDISTNKISNIIRSLR